MSDYLIAPIQRIPRYCLLIKGTLPLLSNHNINFKKNIDLLRYTQPPDMHLENALKAMTCLVTAMDNIT